MAGTTDLTYGNDYTIEWFRSEDGGAWASMGFGDTQNGGAMSVTPRSTNTSYMAVVRGAGSYIGELSFVISNSPVEDDVSLVSLTHGSHIHEGQGLTLTATLQSASGVPVNGGVARFYARVNNGSDVIYLGEASVVNNTAMLVLASTSLPAGHYSIWVEYSGVPGVFNEMGRSSTASSGLTVHSATLESDDFSLSNWANGEDQTSLVPGEENTITLSADDYTFDTDFTYSWMISTDGGLSWSYQPGDDSLELSITPTDNRGW